MGEERGPNEDPPPPTRVPTSFGFDLTLAPSGSETVAFHGDQDVLLTAMSGKAVGPTIIQIQVTDAPPAGTPVLSIPGGTFTEYIERELPAHLAAAAAEELSQWVEKNRVLTGAARAGDDEAFFDLLARDPRQLASELTLGRVITWRTEIDEYNRFFRFKASRFLAPSAAAADAQQRMEEARKKLGRLGASQLDLYDQRGKRAAAPGAPRPRVLLWAPLPPAGSARGIRRKGERRDSPASDRGRSLRACRRIGESGGSIAFPTLCPARGPTDARSGDSDRRGPRRPHAGRTRRDSRCDAL